MFWRDVSISYKYKIVKTLANQGKFAESGNPTYGILSPVRLPVPPLRHMGPIGLEPMTLCL